MKTISLLFMLVLTAPAFAAAPNPQACIAKGTVSTCQSADGKYSLVLTDSPLYSVDFPTGLGLTNLCLMDGMLKLNGRTMAAAELTASSTSSVKGLSLLAPDKSTIAAHAVINIFGPSHGFLSLDNLPDIESIEILVMDSRSGRKLRLYLLHKDGNNFSKVDLACAISP